MISIPEDGRRETNTACDFCSTSFSCSRLNLALKILEADPNVGTDPVKRARIADVKKFLAEARWDFGNGGRRCALAGRTEEVRALTNKLIELLPRAQRAKLAQKKRALEDLPESFQEEEYRYE